MTLNFTHWKAGNVTREVSPMRLAGHFYDRARVFLVTESGDVFNAGDVLHGKPRLKTPVRIGWNGATA